MDKLTGRSAIITVTAAGIGRATTLLFAQECANQAITGHTLMVDSGKRVA